jgi:hypothetical protein
VSAFTPLSEEQTSGERVEHDADDPIETYGMFDLAPLLWCIAEIEHI